MEIEQTAENQQRIRDCFNFYDRDYDGRIDIKQLGTLIRSLGCAPTEDEIKQYITEFGIDGDSFQIEQFELIMTREQSKSFLSNTLVIEEPTDEQVTSYLNSVNSETKKEKDRALLCPFCLKN